MLIRADLKGRTIDAEPLLPRPYNDRRDRFAPDATAANWMQVMLVPVFHDHDSLVLPQRKQ